MSTPFPPGMDEVSGGRVADAATLAEMIARARAELAALTDAPPRRHAVARPRVPRMHEGDDDAHAPCPLQWNYYGEESQTPALVDIVYRLRDEKETLWVH